MTRYTDRADAVLALARGHAQRLRRAAVEPEHLLLAIADAGEGVALNVLASLGVSRDLLRGAVLCRAEPGEHWPGRPVALSEPAAAALARAEKEAEVLAHPRIGTEHLLLALAAEGLGAQVLAGLGVEEGRLRAKVRHPRDAGRGSPGRRFALPPGLDAGNRQIAAARRQKDHAIDTGNLESATAWRREEKRLLDRKRGVIEAWAAGISTVDLVDEIDRLYRLHDALLPHPSESAGLNREQRS
jgi:ATP-dependent Clp protease ATP-binding subunit ClpC